MVGGQSQLLPPHFSVNCFPGADRSQVIFSGPDGLAPHRSHRLAEQRPVGTKAHTSEATGDLNYLFRPPALVLGTPVHLRSRSSQPGEIGWHCYLFRDSGPYSTGHQVLETTPTTDYQGGQRPDQATTRLLLSTPAQQEACLLQGQPSGCNRAPAYNATVPMVGQDGHSQRRQGATPTTDYQDGQRPDKATTLRHPTATAQLGACLLQGETSGCHRAPPYYATAPMTGQDGHPQGRLGAFPTTDCQGGQRPDQATTQLLSTPAQQEACLLQGQPSGCHRTSAYYATVPMAGQDGHSQRRQGATPRTDYQGGQRFDQASTRLLLSTPAQREACLLQGQPSGCHRDPAYYTTVPMVGQDGYSQGRQGATPTTDYQGGQRSDQATTQRHPTAPAQLGACLLQGQPSSCHRAPAYHATVPCSPLPQQRQSFTPHFYTPNPAPSNPPARQQHTGGFPRDRWNQQRSYLSQQSSHRNPNQRHRISLPQQHLSFMGF
ncbi:uncharacterized protein [Littorina saxatilis]|uniref:uncharacterized protein isoform X1 n=1 Tax=Littorina saxatilis TaxID=31220 RepID=UPI0038B69D36